MCNREFIEAGAKQSISQKAKDVVMSRFKSALPFGIAFCFISMITFAALVCLWPGFPFFPKIVYQTKAENADLRLGEGNYYILFFVEGLRNLSVMRGDVGSIQVFSVLPDGKREIMPLSPSNFFFDEAPDEYGIRGHSVGKFTIHGEQELDIRTNLRAYGYDGLIIRTGFRPMIVSMVSFEACVFVCSLLLTRAWVKRKNVDCH
jgi:hypothetical protein